MKMRQPNLLLIGAALVAGALIVPPSAHAGTDWRNIANGYAIPGESYCDHPYVVVTLDGHWVCILTTALRSVELILRSPNGVVRWDSDAGLVRTGKPHHFSVIVDGGLYIISWVVDGLLCDGAPARLVSILRQTRPHQ